MSRKQQRALGVVLAVAAGAATWLVGGLAHASEPFPDKIREHWDVDHLPVQGQGCRLCHTNEVGARQNMTQPFGLTVKRLGGVTGNDNVPALERALDAIKSRGSDSDSDRVSDYEEVAENGTNPNVQNPPPPPDPVGNGGAGGADAAGGEAPLEPLPPLPPLPELPPTLEHGCSLTAAGAGVADAGAPVSLMLVMFSLLGCKRRRSRRQR